MKRVLTSIAVLLALSACAERKPDAAPATAPHSLATAADETFEPVPGIRLRFRQAGAQDAAGDGAVALDVGVALAVAEDVAAGPPVVAVLAGATRSPGYG